MTPYRNHAEEIAAIRAADEAQHRKKVDLYRADLDYHQHFEALDPPPRRVNVLATLSLIIALLMWIVIALVIGDVILKAMTRAVAVQIEEQGR